MSVNDDQCNRLWHSLIPSAKRGSRPADFAPWRAPPRGPGPGRGFPVQRPHHARLSWRPEPVRSGGPEAAAQPDRPRRDLSSLKLILSGASAVPSALVRRTTTTFGCKFSILFGQTELNGVITQTSGDDSPEDQAETAGRPLPQMELKIADPISGEVLPLDTSGEICARGYQTMQGYFNAADATSATLREDGWLHTGDLGAMDERGYVRVTGRLKDMIIRGGENIYPREIEEVLFDHPDIAHVCVIGLPDERWGEVVAAVIRLSANDGAAPDTAPPCAAFVDGLHAWCRSHLAAYKTPAIWFFIDEWPLTASGKVRRHVLREQILGGGHRGLVATKTPARPAG